MSTTEDATTATPEDVGTRRLLIAGTWCDAESGRTFDVINPADEQVVGTLPEAGPADVDRAVRSASEAFGDGGGDWPLTPLAERQAILGRVVDTLEQRLETIAALEVAHGGMTIRNALGFHAQGTIGLIRATLAMAPTDALVGLPMEEQPTLSANYVRREPIGVVAALPPSNGGFFLGVYKSLCALVTGNTVVLKTSPKCALATIELAKAIAAEPAIPAGAFHLLHSETEAGPALTSHPLVGKISFTGSPETGRRVLAAAAPNLSRVTLELGGKGPSIVLDDANLDAATDGIVWGFLWQTGQACIAGSRLLVPDHLHDEVVARLKARLERLVIGDPMDPATDFGPVVSAMQRDKIEQMVARAREQGATVVTGGERPDMPAGFWAQPALLTDVTNDMEIARNEVFGPVLAVIRYSDDAEALRIANDTEFGLSATVWSTDNVRALALVKRLRAGTVWINDHHMLSPNAPFGGFKNSGLGREFGQAGLEAFTELKHVHIDLGNGAPNPVHGILLGH